MAIEPIDTQQWIPWPEEVTITSVRPNSANVAEEVDNAGVYQLGNGEASPSYGVYTRFDIRVTLATDGVSFVPKPRDTVLWKENTYTVLDVSGSDWTKHYVLTARNLILHADLRQSGTLKRPPNTQDTSARASLAAYSTLASGIPCRLQPQGGVAGDVLDRRTMPKRYAAIIGQQLDARAKDRFEVGGDVYTVLEVRNPERIDELPVYILEDVL